MKESKAVYVTKHKIRDDQNFVYQLYANHAREHSDRYDSRNFGCQYDDKRTSVVCTCRNTSPKRPQDMRYFSGVPKQVYAYHGSRSFTDIGVGSMKALQRKKVKKVYLPETDDRGVGSSDLSSFIIRRNKQQKNSYYDHKRTSSKCVGGFLEHNSVISQKLSPIVQTISGSTSPKMSIDQRNIEIGSNTIDKNFVTTGTQFEIESIETEEPNEEKLKIDRETGSPKKVVVKVSEHTQKNKYSLEIQSKIKPVMQKKVKEADKVYSSDSLVQHVHNLENPSDEKQSRASIDPMENKLEREYRRMFSTKDRDSKPSIDNPVPEFKSASILRRRFEALRRGLKKDDGKKSTMPSSQDSVPSRKDASVTSDPPSLECRSFTDTKRYSPIQANIELDKNKINYNAEGDSTQWPQSDIDSECQGVKGMFNLWGKKFKFEEEAEKVEKVKKRPLAIDINKKPHKEVKPKKETENKKAGRKFFFFKKKNKDQKIEKPNKKEKEVFTSSGVTAGRCEIRDGLIMKVGNKKPTKKVSDISEEGDEIQRRTWFKNFVTNTIASARSVNIRWNNSMYATSSSTVFELMDTIYKNNGVVLKSRSEITSEESSYYRSYTKNKVYFDQNIEAWMIPQTITDRPREIPVRIQSHREIKIRDIDVTISDHKWFIEKSKAFANKIEVFLHSNNLDRMTNNVSSEYLRIDIPNDFFDVSSSDGSKQNPTSDEEVYKIVEYESVMNTKKTVAIEDHTSEIQMIVSVQDSKNLEAKILETVIKRPPMHRDVVIQGSNVNIPKRCDVIGVGIITRRDMRDIKKPILKIQDDLTDDDSDEALQINTKKCEFAESFLQEYYKHWTPLGIDLFSWCVSDSQLRSCSEKSLISFHNQGDGSKSCPNICEDFQTSAIVSSCNTSSCSQCYEELQQKVPESSFSSKLKKLIEPLKAKTDTDIAYKRVLPKDSLEVFKRRKIYAASLKSQWACSEDKPVSVPSIESKGAQNTLVDCTKSCKPDNNMSYKKHVSMLDCDKINEMLAPSPKKHEGILAFKGQVGCEACKKKGKKCAKHAVVNTEPTEIPDPACKVCCEKSMNPACGRTNSPSNKSLMQSAMSKISQILGSPKDTQVFEKPCTGCPTPCPFSLNPPSCQHSSPPTPIKEVPLSPTGSKRSSPKTNHGCLSPVQAPSPLKSCKTESPITSCRSPPCSPPLSAPGCKRPSPKTSHDCLSPAQTPTQLKARRKASPNIQCRSPPCSPPLSPAGSKDPSPKPSHDCICPVQPPKQLKVCKKPSPNIKCRPPRCSPPLSPAGSKGPSPKTSHDCLSPARDLNPQKKKCAKKPCAPRNEKRCPKCQKKQPCPLFPNCKLSPAESMGICQGFSPQQSPRESPKTSPLGSPKKKQKKTSPCRLPLCSRPKQTSNCSVNKNMKTPPKPPCESDQFPWPTNSHASDPPSPSCSDTSQRKNKCPLMQKTSDQSLAQKTVKKCKPDCASLKKKEELENRLKERLARKQQECPENKQQPCPVKQQQPCPAKPQRNPDPQCKRSSTEISKAKISGLFLKMRPFKKTCSKECVAWESQDEQRVVRLNSRENITISMKKDTPSTEEIREGMNMNIKVRDDDGNTLFERKDYTCGPSGHRPSVLGDMYKDSAIHRVSTPVMVVTNDVTTNNQEEKVAGYKSDTSLANLIEIQFKLRITQGDKTTEINIANEDEAKQDKVDEGSKKVSEVFVVENAAREPIKSVEEGPKNDINIKIIVKNYKPKLNKTYDYKKYDDTYSKKISDKFQTVSTGYSDMLADQDDDNVFSIHRATVDLDSSNDQSKTLSEPSNEAVSEELTEPINFMVSSHSMKHLAADVTDDKTSVSVNEKSVSSKKDTQSYDNYDYTNELDAKDLDTDQDATIDLNTSNECNDIIYNSKEEKKELLKRVFERAYTTPKNKENVRQLRDSLKIILTDSSDNEMNAASNELAKDITYASLKPDYFRNTDSMNNYYKIDSSLTVEGSKVTSNILYPTGENNSCTSGTSTKIRPQGCMCNRVAERLNCNLKTGCCCKQTTLDEITSCNIKNDQDFLLSNNRVVDYVDAYTQNSKQLSNHSHRTNLPKHSHDNYSTQIETDKISITERTTDTANESKMVLRTPVIKTFFSHKNHIKEYEMKNLHHTTILGISDDDKIVLLSEEATRKIIGEKDRKKQKDNIVNSKINLFKAAEVLQCYETKKAVLEIYAEKTVSENGEHFVAKLPKFVYEKESEITRNYKEIATNSYKSVCRRNVIRMSINR